MNYIAIAVTFLCVSFYARGENYTRTIYINPSTGEDSQTCLTANSPSSPCANLTWVLLRAESHSSSTHFVLSEGTHYLREPTSPFQDLTSLALTGKSSVVSCTQPETGLAFINVVGLVFSDIRFENCSAVRNSTSKNFLTDSSIPFRVALYFYLCESISMSSVSVSHSPNATGVVVYDTNGTNTFTNSNFSHNILSDTEEEYPGGGGFYVEFTYCPPGQLECDTPTGNRNDGSTYTFEECEFSHNVANNLNSIEENTYIFPYGLNHQALGRGGGLSLFVRNKAKNIKFTVNKSKFHSNTASWGAGLFVEFHDVTYGNVVTVKASEFSDNFCPFTSDNGTAGAAIRLAHYIYGLYEFDRLPENANRNEIVIEDGNFINNTAMYGAGISISLAPQNSDVEQLVFIYVRNATFLNNMAKLGSGIHVDRFWTISQGLMPRVWIEDTSFDKNTDQYFFRIKQEDKPYQIGYGTVCLTSTSAWFRGTISFVNGLGSALAMAGATASFNGSDVLFENYYANKGAAIALSGASTIEVGYNTRMVFRNNTAETKGGAINVLYISRENLVSDSKCFIRHVDPSISPDMWNVSVKFIDNMEKKNRSNAIYTTSLLPCYVIGGSGRMMNQSKILCWEGWEYISGNKSVECETQISSDIARIMYTGSDPRAKDHVKAFPGWEFDLPISTFDDTQTPLPYTAVFAVTANNSTHTDVVYGKKTSLSGEENSTYKLTLETMGERVWYIDVNVDMQKCPPGFKHSKDSVCVCASGYAGSLDCNFKAREAFLTVNTWMGLFNNTYYTATCPRGYCNDISRYYLLPNCSDALDGVLCTPNRKGVLCGECAEGHGPSVNSKTFKCVECTDINLAINVAKYVASVYIPLVALFLVLIFFDIRLTNGPANAFILYCQVVSGSFGLDMEGRIQFVSHPERWLAGFTLPYGIFNLEFVEGYIPDICFSTSFNTLTALCLDYLVALSPLLMIMVIVMAYKCKELCCRWCPTCKSPRCLRQKSRSIGGALLPAFASFVLLSYTKFSTVSTYIITSRPLIDENGTTHPSNRVFLAGHLPYNSAGYYPYFLVAIVVFATFVAIPPILLLDYPLRVLEWLISKSRHLERIYPRAKIHILLDTFQGCYRKNMGFFAGLYFLFRLITNMLYIFCGSLFQRLAVQQVMCLLMAVLVGLLRPYRRSFLNYVDCLIFANLAFLNSISHYLLELNQFAGYFSSQAATFYFQYVMVFLPLVYMLAYVIWTRTVPHHHKIKSVFHSFRLRFGSPRRYQQLDIIARDDLSVSSAHCQLAATQPSVNAEPKSDIDALFERAGERNHYQSPLPVTIVGVRQDSWGDGDASVRQTAATRDSGMLLSSNRHSRRSNDSGGGKERSYGSTGESSRVSSDSAHRSDSGNQK